MAFRRASYQFRRQSGNGRFEKTFHRGNLLPMKNRRRYHYGGSLRLANNCGALDGYRHFISVARAMGVALELLDAAECRRRHPLINIEEFIGRVVRSA